MENTPEMENTLVKSALSAISTVYGKESSAIDTEQIVDWFSKASQSIDLTSNMTPDQIRTLADDALSQGGPVLDAEFTRRNLARWFEVPEEEFQNTPPSQLEPEVLIRHLYFEHTFKGWLEKWGYDTSVGEDLEGRESIDFTPDVYGQLQTLHGDFELLINFVCDNPPSQYRVRALLETLEAYATDSSEFKRGDIYVLATPFQFGKGASASIVLQGKEELYSVVKLEGDDLYDLSRARDDLARLEQFKEHVEKAKPQEH